MADSSPDSQSPAPEDRMAEIRRQLEGFKLPPHLQKFIDRQNEQFAEVQKAMAAVPQPEAYLPSAPMQNPNSAAEFHHRLQDYIAKFEAALDQSHEVDIRLVNFGSEVRFRLEHLGHWNPSLITFSGRMDDGSPVQLIQHVSQISVLLMAAKRANASTPRKPIGFA